MMLLLFMLKEKFTYVKVHVWYMSKDVAISIINNSNLIDKKGVLQFFY